MARAAALAWLVVVWLGLWESLTAANLAGGLLAGSVLMLAFPSRDGVRGAGRLRPLATLAFLGYFLWKIIEANLIVTWEVITPGSRVNEGIVAVPVAGASPVVLGLLANAISLTPGTLVVEATRQPPVLYVHVLHLRSVEQVRLDIFRLERRLARAIGAPETLRDVDARIAELGAPGRDHRGARP